jgi:hypothetical protein
MRAKDESGFHRFRLGAVLLALIAVATAFICSGCLLLAIPSLGYEGYEYEKTGSIPGVPSSGSSSSPNQNSKNNNSSNNSTSGDHSIE